MLQETKGRVRTSAAAGCKSDDPLICGCGGKLSVSVGVLFPDSVISVVIEQHIRCRMAHLDRRQDEDQCAPDVVTSGHRAQKIRLASVHLCGSHTATRLFALGIPVSRPAAREVRHAAGRR